MLPLPLQPKTGSSFYYTRDTRGIEACDQWAHLRCLSPGHCGQDRNFAAVANRWRQRTIGPTLELNPRPPAPMSLLNMLTGRFISPKNHLTTSQLLPAFLQTNDFLLTFSVELAHQLNLCYLSSTSRSRNLDQ